jgi:SAM-dependent methyltransferase
MDASSSSRSYAFLGYWLRFLNWLEAKSVHFFLRRTGLTHPRAAFGLRNTLIAQHVRPGSRVIDLGCGSGALAKKLAAEKACSVIGIDQSPPRAAIAGVEFRRGDITDSKVLASLRDSGAEAIVLSHILEHLDDPVGELKNLRWASRIIICVPGKDSWRQIFFRRQGLESRLDPDHRKEYDEAMLQKEIESAGLRCLEIKYTSDGEILAVCVPSN